MTKTALIAGVSGITGQNLANHLAENSDWTVFGLSRKEFHLAGITPLAADLLDPKTLSEAVANKKITHVYFTSWQKMESEERNCEVNGAMLKNLLEALKGCPLEHVALVTGGKNYFGSFSDSGKFEVTTPYREEQSRKPGLNFYYTQEDILFEYASKLGFSWSVHRPNTVIGYAIGNAMNMGISLAVYATICKENGRPFLFPGSPTIYNGVCDLTDARIVAKQLHWAGITEGAKNQAFNIVNGDVFRWNWMWKEIANYFEIEVAEYPGYAISLEEQMKTSSPEWDKIVTKYGLQPLKMEKLASWWHSDSDLSRTFETFADMSKSRQLGFTEYQKSNQSFFDLFNRLRREKIIPA